MRRWICGLALVVWVGSGSAEPEKLKPVDVQQLLERLKELEEGAQGRSSARLSTARAAFAVAVQSDGAALELYLKCVEKVEYEEADRSSQAFREWKRRSRERMGPEFQRALRHQLNWLLLVVEVSMSPGKEEEHARKAMDKLDQMLGDLEEMGGERRMLNSSVLSSVFSTSFGLSSLELGADWPASPLRLADVYDNLILPPLRTPGKVVDLRAAWLKRIRQEELLAIPVDNGREKGLRTDDAPAQLVQFRIEERPELIWQMEVDLFGAGDERGAAKRMVEHIEKHLGHKSEKKWVGEFQGLVTGEAEEETTGG